MYKIAIILFPGLNTELETARGVEAAGMRAILHRWNEDPRKLANYDGYIIGGGFAYEDRGRAGIIASLEPIMETLRKEAHNGKPLLGICNGAQILVESGLVPGSEGDKLAHALAQNKRMQNGRVLGTGYYDTWVTFKCAIEPKHSFFTWNMSKDEILRAPIAHGEGRFTTEIPDLMLQLRDREQMPLRYCDTQGVIHGDFPVNPNGAMFAAAAICNPAGNIMAIMPHLERSPEASVKLFSSLHEGLKAGGVSRKTSKLQTKLLPTFPEKTYAPNPPSFELLVFPKITDNEKQTFEITLQRMGFNNLMLEHCKHYEIGLRAKNSLEPMVKKLIASGVLMNTNKEMAIVLTEGKRMLVKDNGTLVPMAKETPGEGYRCAILVREKEDLLGISKLAIIQNRLGLDEVTKLHTGTAWRITFPTKSSTVAGSSLKKILATHLFHNPHRQDIFFHK